MADRSNPYAQGQGQGGGGGGAPHHQSPYGRGPRRGGGAGGGRGYRGGYHDGGYHHNQHQQHNQESRAEQKARQLKINLYKLGEEKDFHPPSDLLKLARWIEERSRDGVEPITAAFRIMVVEQPHKLPLIAALIGFMCLSPHNRNSAAADAADRRKSSDQAATDDQDPYAQDELLQQQANPETVGLTVVKDLVRAFRTYLDARLWRNVRLSLHLFAALVPLQIISASSLRTLLSSFAAVLEEPGVAATRGDRAAICIIETLCRAGQDLLQPDEDAMANAGPDAAQQELDALVDKVLAYNSSRKVENELAAPFSADVVNGVLRQESFEDCVRALETLRTHGYKRPAFLPTPTDLLPAAISSAESSLSKDERSVSLPDVLVPPDEDLDEAGVDVAFAQLGEPAGNRMKRHARSGKVDTGKGEADQRRAGTGPERIHRQARWFADSVPQPGSPSSVVLRAILADMIDLYEVNRKDAARLILDLPAWLRRGTFGGKVSPDAGLFGEAEDEWWYVSHTAAGDGGDGGEAQSIEGGWSLDDLIVEMVLSTSLVLPSPPRNALYYTALLREVVSVTPGTIAPSLGRTIRTFYAAMGTGQIDVEVLDRFADWFSIHLSNFNFGWAWKEWVGDVSLPASHPRSAFVRRTVELEVRLAYYDRIKQTLPDEIQRSALAPEEPLPAFTYGDESHPYHAQASRLINSIRAKAAAEVIMADFESFKASILPDASGVAGGEEEAGKVENEQQAEAVVRDIAIQAVLSVGSRSFSHFLNIVERYHGLLRQLSSSPRMRMAILCGATRFWARSAQWVNIVIDKLLQYRIVEPADVIEFVFSPPTDEPAPVLLGSGDGVAHSFSKVPATAAGGLQRDWSSFNWWLIIRLTLKKVNGRVDQLQKRLEDIEREEALELERKEAALAAGLDEDADNDKAESAETGLTLPLFPTSASLPPRPEVAAVKEEEKRRATSQEAKASLEAIQVEQRKVFVSALGGFLKLVRQLDALKLDSSGGVDQTQEWTELQWQSWWIRGWFLELCRSVSCPAQIAFDFPDFLAFPLHPHSLLRHG
ncbi:Nuclear cap-binding protein subunit 1 [Thecaphora frezii]